MEDDHQKDNLVGEAPLVTAAGLTDQLLMWYISEGVGAGGHPRAVVGEVEVTVVVEAAGHGGAGDVVNRAVDLDGGGVAGASAEWMVD